MIVTPEQMRAARALLRMEQDELARRSQVSVVTIRRLETADGLQRIAPATLAGVRHVLEDAGPSSSRVVSGGEKISGRNRSTVSRNYADQRTERGAQTRTR
jgi:predicted transcriptional regulator